MDKLSKVVVEVAFFVGNPVVADINNRWVLKESKPLVTAIISKIPFSRAVIRIQSLILIQSYDSHPEL